MYDIYIYNLKFWKNCACKMLSLQLLIVYCTCMCVYKNIFNFTCVNWIFITYMYPLLTMMCCLSLILLLLLCRNLILWCLTVRRCQLRVQLCVYQSRQTSTIGCSWSVAHSLTDWQKTLIGWETYLVNNYVTVTITLIGNWVLNI